MWPILLKILSIIGIVLGSIIGVVLLLVIIVLLAPIVYKAEGSAHDNKYFVKLRAHYLFGIVRAGYTYPEPGNIYAKAAWFTLYDSAKKEEDDDDHSSPKDDSEQFGSDHTDGKKTDENNADTNNADTNNADTEHNDSEHDDTKHSDINQSENNPEASDDTKPLDVKRINKKYNKKDNEKDKSSSEKKKRVLNPLYYIKKAWIKFRQKVVNKIKLLYKNISFYIKLLQHDDTQALWQKIKKHLIKILKQLAPKRGRANMIIGMDSPDTTAYIFGVYSLLLNRWNKKIVLEPDFEKKIIDGEGYMKGWFCLGGILVQALPVLLSKKLRLFKARIDKHQENMEKATNKFERAIEKDYKELEADYEQ